MSAFQAAMFFSIESNLAKIRSSRSDCPQKEKVQNRFDLIIGGSPKNASFYSSVHFTVVDPHPEESALFCRISNDNAVFHLEKKKYLLTFHKKIFLEKND